MVGSDIHFVPPGTMEWTGAIRLIVHLGTHSGTRLKFKRGEIVARKLKQPTGAIYEEFITASSYHFENGELSGYIHTTDDGTYTGRFWFRYPDGKCTKMYTEKTAPKWLLVFYNKALSI